MFRNRMFSLLVCLKPEVRGYLPVLLIHRTCRCRIDNSAEEFLGAGVRDGQAESAPGEIDLAMTVMWRTANRATGCDKDQWGFLAQCRSYTQSLSPESEINHDHCR